MREGRYFDSTNNIPLKDGEVAEKEAFGEVIKPITLEQYKEIVRKGGFIEFEEAMDAVKGMQPEGKLPDFASSLKQNISKNLYDLWRQKETEEVEHLNFFTSVHSSLDYGHSTDAFFEFKTADGESRIITMDVTVDPEKELGKANINILLPSKGMDKKLDIEQFNGTVDRVTEGVLKKFLDPRAYVHLIDYEPSKDEYGY